MRGHSSWRKQFSSFINHHQLILILMAGLCLRLLGLINITLAGDFAYHWQVAGNIINTGKLPLLGPSASVNDTFHLGPFYYYLLAIPYALGQGNFRVAIVFFAVLNTASIWLVYKVCAHQWNTKVSLQITALYALSSYVVSIQNFPWNPYIVPSLMVCLLYFLQQLRQQKQHYLIGVAACLALLLQGHGTAIFLLPVASLLIPWRQISLKWYVASISAVILLFSTWLYSDITTDFTQTKAALAIFVPAPNQGCTFSYYLQNHGNGERCFAFIRNTLFIFRLFSTSVLGTRSFPVVVVTMAAVLLSIFKNRTSRTWQLIGLWIGIPWLLLLFYSNNIYLHYFLWLLPLPFIWVVLLLERLRQTGQTGVVIANLIFAFLIAANVLYYLLSLVTVRG